MRAEHLVDEALGSDILDLGKDGRFFLLRVETIANSVVDESHQTCGDDYAERFVSELL